MGTPSGLNALQEFKHPGDINRGEPLRAGHLGHPIGRVAYAALPFFVLMCIGVVILTAFPEIALWLPAALFDKAPAG